MSSGFDGSDMMSEGPTRSDGSDRSENIKVSEVNLSRLLGLFLSDLTAEILDNN